MHTTRAWRSLLAASLLIATTLPLQAQSYAGDVADVEPITLVDKPTAGMLKRATFALSGNFYQRGGVLAGLSVGVFDRFMIGLTYGGTDIIGPNRIDMNPFPGVQARLRIIGEGALLPAIAIGFDSQGKEPYVDSLGRYTIKAPGGYLTASRNYAFLGNLSFHGGLLFSTERRDGDRDMNAYVGLEKSVGEDISILAEYDFAFNDNHGGAVGEGRGYLNIGFRWSWGKGLVLGLDLKNVTKNRENISVANRTLQIDFVGAL